MSTDRVPAESSPAWCASTRSDESLLTTVGSALAGPAASLLGMSGALWLAAGAVVIYNVTRLAIPSVWSLHASLRTNCSPPKGRERLAAHTRPAGLSIAVRLARSQ